MPAVSRAQRRCALIALAFVVGLAMPVEGMADDACVCAAARETHGWCADCAVGYVGDVPIQSHYLWEVLDAHGHSLNIEKLACAGCTEAAATDGFCAKSRIGFVDGAAYFSRLTWLLAQATREDPATLQCSMCRANATQSGWCTEHSVGRLGRFALHDRADFDALVHDMEILAKAISAAARCEHCAAAIVTDTQCPICRISYKNGDPE